MAESATPPTAAGPGPGKPPAPAQRAAALEAALAQAGDRIAALEADLAGLRKLLRKVIEEAKWRVQEEERQDRERSLHLGGHKTGFFP
jgi:hypothetical protein